MIANKNAKLSPAMKELLDAMTSQTEVRTITYPAGTTVWSNDRERVWRGVMNVNLATLRALRDRGLLVVIDATPMSRPRGYSRDKYYVLAAGYGLPTYEANIEQAWEDAAEFNRQLDTCLSLDAAWQKAEMYRAAIDAATAHIDWAFKSSER